MAENQHNSELACNAQRWQNKPLLQRIYRDFYHAIGAYVRPRTIGPCVEIGSGLASVKEVIPYCLRTNLFKYPWVDQVENAYSLSFDDNSIGTLILFDVFHHLQFPGTALRECRRVLVQGGRVIIFDPCLSLFGRIVYGLLHPEPIGNLADIAWDAPTTFDPVHAPYYAAQGNTYRIFWGNSYQSSLADWRIFAKKRFAALSYVASGGYSKGQWYPDAFYPFFRRFDSVLDLVPSIWATRALVVLEKEESKS